MENYDLAKKLKNCTDRLKTLGIEIGKLEHKKRIAVAQEDYDLASSLKARL
jgi:hypothetical protein